MSVKEWPKVKLGEHVDLLAGFSFKSSKFTGNSYDIPLVKGENLHQRFIDWERAKRWPVCEIGQYEKYILKIGDVVLAMDRPWIDAGLKFSWIKPKDPKSLLVQRVARLRGKNGLLTSFLRYIIGSPAFTDYIKPIVTGVNVPHISGDQICSFTFCLPPLPTQRKIAAILSAYDDLIENNNRRIKILEETARLIYREWFVNFRLPGHEKVKMVDSPLGRIPEGWEIKPVSDVLYLNPKETVDKEVEKPFVSMDGLTTDSSLVSITQMRTGNSGAKFRNGDTLFARITPCLENGKTGLVQCLDNSTQVGIGSTEFIVLRSKILTPEFVYLLSREETFRNNAIKSMAGASGRQRVNNNCFSKYFIAQPLKDVLDDFSKIMNPVFNQIHTLSLKNGNLKKTRDLLLPKLISGELDVSELDIEIPEEAA